jgi:hypothetical protein
MWMCPSPPHNDDGTYWTSGQHLCSFSRSPPSPPHSLTLLEEVGQVGSRDVTEAWRGQDDDGKGTEARRTGHTPGTTEPETASRQEHEEAADIADPYTTCAEPMMPAGMSQNPPDQSGATSQVRMLPSEDASDRETQGAMGDKVEDGETDNEDGRVEMRPPQ